MELLRHTRRHWPTVAAYGAVGLGVAAGTVPLVPPVFTSRAAVQSEAATAQALGNPLAGLASQLAGVEIARPGNPQFLADLIQSEAVIGRTARARYPWDGDTLPLAAIYGFEGEERSVGYRTRQRLRKAVSTRVNVRSGIVEVTVEGRTPVLAKALADSLLRSLHMTQLQLRQDRGSAELTFAARQLEVARRELTSAENALTTFLERNREYRSSAALRTEQERLARAVDLAQKLHLEAAMQEEQARSKAVRATPLMTIVDAPALPVRRTRPLWSRALVTGLVVGLSIAFLRINVRSLLGIDGKTVGR